MATVRIDGWRPGFDKVGHTHALQSHGHMPLSSAKAITDAVLKRTTQEVALPSQAEAEALASLLHSLGANAQVVS
jgi:hypothetical protein